MWHLSAFELARWRVVWIPASLLIGAVIGYYQLEAGTMGPVETIATSVFFFLMGSAAIFSVDATYKDSTWSLLALAVEFFIFGVWGSLIGVVLFMFFR